MAPRARQAKSKARITRYEELREEAARQTEGTAEILIPVPERLGDEVVIAKNLSKGYGDRLLIDDLSFALPRGGIVGVIGPNGAGKTTLFRMITGQEQPDGGDAHGRAPRCRSPTWTRAATRSTRRRRSTRRSPAGRTRCSSASAA